MARHVLRGLAAAHAKGLTHRDIKPSNLWVESPEDRIKVLDFGIVRDVADGGKVTATGQVLGSVAYVSLEQALGGLVDARADVYSVGVVMYQMLVGKNPFDKGSYNTTLIAVYTENPPPVGEVLPGVPTEVSAYVARLMSKERDGRPADATPMPRQGVVDTDFDVPRPTPERPTAEGEGGRSGPSRPPRR